MTKSKTSSEYLYPNSNEDIPGSDYKESRSKNTKKPPPPVYEDQTKMRKDIADKVAIQETQKGKIAKTQKTVDKLNSELQEMQKARLFNEENVSTCEATEKKCSEDVTNCKATLDASIEKVGICNTKTDDKKAAKVAADSIHAIYAYSIEPGSMHVLNTTVDSTLRDWNEAKAQIPKMTAEWGPLKNDAFKLSSELFFRTATETLAHKQTVWASEAVEKAKRAYETNETTWKENLRNLLWAKRSEEELKAAKEDLKTAIDNAETHHTNTAKQESDTLQYYITKQATLDEMVIRINDIPLNITALTLKIPELEAAYNVASTALNVANASYWTENADDGSEWGQANNELLTANAELKDAENAKTDANTAVTNATIRWKTAGSNLDSARNISTTYNESIIGPKQHELGEEMNALERQKTVYKEGEKKLSQLKPEYRDAAGGRHKAHTSNTFLQNSVEYVRDIGPISSIAGLSGRCTDATLNLFVMPFMSSDPHISPLFNNIGPAVYTIMPPSETALQIRMAQAAVLAGTALLSVSRTSRYGWVRVVASIMCVTLIMQVWDALLDTKLQYYLGTIFNVFTWSMIGDGTRKLWHRFSNRNTAYYQTLTNTFWWCVCIVGFLLILCIHNTSLFDVNHGCRMIMLKSETFSDAWPFVQGLSVWYGIGVKLNFVPAQLAAWHYSRWLRMKEDIDKQPQNWIKKNIFPYGKTIILLCLNVLVAMLIHHKGLINLLLHFGWVDTNVSESEDVDTNSWLRWLQINGYIGTFDANPTPVQQFFRGVNNFIGSDFISFICNIWFQCNNREASLLALGTTTFRAIPTIERMISLNETSVLFSIRAAPAITWATPRNDTLECLYDYYYGGPGTVRGKGANTTNFDYKPTNFVAHEGRIMKMFKSCKTPYCFMPGDLLEECAAPSGPTWKKQVKRILQIVCKNDTTDLTNWCAVDRMWADKGMYLVLGNEDGTTSDWPIATPLANLDLDVENRRLHLPVRVVETQWIPRSETYRLAEWLVDAVGLIDTANNILNRPNDASLNVFCPHHLRFALKGRSNNRYACVLFTFQTISPAFLSKVRSALFDTKRTMCVYNVCIGENDTISREIFLTRLQATMGVHIDSIQDLCIVYEFNKVRSHRLQYHSLKVINRTLLGHASFPYNRRPYIEKSRVFGTRASLSLVGTVGATGIVLRCAQTLYITPIKQNLIT